MKTQICRPWICSGFLLLVTTTNGTASTNAAQAEVKLTGITALFGEKQALLSVREPAGSGQCLGQPYACTLGEGQSSGPIRVLEIDQAAGRIWIANGDVEEELTFSRNGVPAPVLPVSATYARSPACYPVVRQLPVVYRAPQCVTPQNQVIIVGGGYRSPGFSSLPARRFSSTFVPGPPYSSCYRPSFNTCRAPVYGHHRGGSYGRFRPCR